MSRRNQASRRRAYGRRQHELRQDQLRQRREGREQRADEWLDWSSDHHFGGPPAGGRPDRSPSDQGRAGA